ncbi:Diacylglycerol O-acyltransferase 1 isoform 3 [Schistosoma japonicum]|uniref:O-acyltransferase n=2 Tax=Schistosoma japonicum TaxID=6182 RepID=A0A4Z2CPT5_SCHJA|nr:Diacylglycerol O-acyltransferase 1 isoform 3 [Schistosoma japonicum]
MMKPIHRPVQSLFSTSSGFNNFRGLLNLAAFLLLISTSRMALENIIKYGIIMDPFSWIRFLLQAQQKCAVFGLLSCTNLFIIFSWLVERAVVSRLIGGKFAMALICWNLFCLLAFPIIMILSIDFNPLFSAPVLGVYTIVFLKLFSYAAVNRWCRESTEEGDYDVGVVLSLLGQTAPTKDPTHNTNVSKPEVSAPEPSHCLDSCSETINNDNLIDKSLKENQLVKRKCFPVLEDPGANLQENGANANMHNKTDDSKSKEENTSEVTYQTVQSRNHKTSNLFPKCVPLTNHVKSMKHHSQSQIRHKSQSKKSQHSRFSVCESKDYSSINPDPVELEVNVLVHDENCVKFSRNLYVTYPNNLTLWDIYYFIFAPTLCYELNFPRTMTIRKQFLFKRIFELIFIPQLILCLIQQWILPLLSNSFTPFTESRFSLIVERCLKLAIPNHLIWLLFFYLVFHSILNVIGEILYFGDRFFYSDWWNAETVPAFWSKWNIPVHRFARRHIYIPLLKSGFSRMQAGLVVFMISAFFHEILVSIPLKMPRFWAFFGMLSQVPYAYMVSCLFPNGGQGGNLAVWLTLIIGQPLTILAYFHDYFITHYNFGGK